MSKVIKFVGVLAVVASLALVGCDKKPAQDEHAGHDHGSHAGHDHGSHAGHDHGPEVSHDVETVKAEVEEVILQKRCPVMDGVINKDLFVEYKGKKVYFCCPGCEKSFEESPEEYIGKLPQFKK